jgi:hypothetical protein
MDRISISALIRETLSAYHYDPPPPGSTIGVPWSAEKVSSYVEKLKVALVEPYRQRFELQENYEQTKQQEPSYEEYWVVAESGTYLEWYDPSTGDFGLGQRLEGRAIPVSIGTRGDLVGVFCAM